MSSAHVFVKPTGVLRGVDPFHVTHGMFRPTRATLSRACAEWLGEASDVSVGTALSRACELADRHNLNVLGGVFLAGLEYLGYVEQCIGRILVTQREIEFVHTIYPDLSSVVLDDDPPAKLLNNLGYYSIHVVTAPRPDNVYYHLSATKAQFRESLRRWLPTVDIGGCGDHVVHVPDNAFQEHVQVAAAARLRCTA
jgi:hypothetical protein